MKFRRSIVRESIWFLAAVVGGLSLTAFFIFTHVNRSGLEDLFRQRLSRTEQVLERYGRVNSEARVSDIEGIMTSPRFLAAVETGDPATVAEEISTHFVLSNADLVMIADPRGQVLFQTESASSQAPSEAIQRAQAANALDVSFMTTPDGHVCELVVADIAANNGHSVGSLVLGTTLNDLYAEDLHRLTGFDIVLSLDGEHVGGHFEIESLDDESAQKLVEIATGSITKTLLGRETYLSLTAADPLSGLNVTFVGSLNQRLDPIVQETIRTILPTVVLGALLAMGLFHLWARRRIVSQIRDLVTATERIGRDDLNFTIETKSQDELGYLAGELDKMRAQLAENREELDRAHQERLQSTRMAALGQMATGIIHDFKNPMAVVLGTAEVMTRRIGDDEKLARQCDVIRTQIDRMSSLTRDVLEFANGRRVLDVEEVDLTPYLGEIRDAHLEPCVRAGVKLEVDSPGRLVVTIDPHRMRRVIDNLINNAREISKVGDQIRLLCQVNDEGGADLVVEDDGPGIPQEKREAVFDAFVTEGKDGGSGLGLAIARKIAEDHGATLFVTEAASGGARFVIALPAKLRAGANESTHSIQSEVSP